MMHTDFIPNLKTTKSHLKKPNKPKNKSSYRSVYRRLYSLGLSYAMCINDKHGPLRWMRHKRDGWDTPKMVKHGYYGKESQRSFRNRSEPFWKISPQWFRFQKHNYAWGSVSWQHTLSRKEKYIIIRSHLSGPLKFRKVMDEHEQAMD